LQQFLVDSFKELSEAYKALPKKAPVQEAKPAETEKQ
jgi:hypothetical protein